jgi:hypothetical protein
MAIAPVLKTGVRKGMGVRIPRSPLPLASVSVCKFFGAPVQVNGIAHIEFPARTGNAPKTF